MAKINAQKISKSSSAHTYSAASSGGDTFDSFDGIVINAKNAHASIARVITIAAVTDPLITPEAGSLVVPDIVITVPAVGDRLFSVPPSHLSSAGLASMTYDDEADVTLAVLYAAQ